MTGNEHLTPVTPRSDTYSNVHPITPRDLGLGLNVTRYNGDRSMVGVVVSIDRDTDEAWTGSGPWVIVRWPDLSSEIPVGHLLRVGRRLHWDGDPDACAEDCDGSHYGDHIPADAACQRCGGSARGCYVDTGGEGCSDPMCTMRYRKPGE